MIKMKVLGNELYGEAWRQAMMKELTPYIPSGVSLGIADDDFGTVMLDYMVDGTIEMINMHNDANRIKGIWFLMGSDLYYDDEENV
jgi:hypothetical protein